MRSSIFILTFVIAHFFWSAAAAGFTGLVVSELPLGGDVTVPGTYPIAVPPNLDVVFSGVESHQTITITNPARSQATVKIYASHESKVRMLKLKAGTSAIYHLLNRKPVRLRVIEGEANVSSLDPLKIQR